MPFMKIVAYDVQTKARLGDVTDAIEPSLDVPHCTGGTPVLSLSGRALGRGVDLLDALPEVAVEVWNGATWVEPPGARFHVTGFQWASNDPANSTRQYECLHVSRLNALGRFGTGPGMTTDGSWRTASVGPGVIAGFMAREKTRGWWPALTYNFTETTDTSGAPWTSTRVREYQPTDSFAAVLDALAESGEAEYTYQGHELRLYNPGTALAVDRSAAVIFGARASSDAPEKTTLEGVFTAVQVKGEGGRVFEVVNPSANPRWGKTTSLVESSGVTTQEQAQSQAAPLLLAAQDKREEYTRKFDLRITGTPRPFIDYGVGDYVGIERYVAGRMVVEKARVMKISVQGDGGHVTLGTLLDGLLTRITNRLKPITTTAGGDATTRGPSVERDLAADGVRPQVFSEIYITQGWPRGRIRLQWPAVTRSAAYYQPSAGTWYPVLEAGTIECDEYKIEARQLAGVQMPPAMQNVWVTLAKTAGTDYVHEGLHPGDRWEYQVTAIAKAATAWGYTYEAYPEGTTTPNLPLKPTAVIAEVERDIIPPPAPSAITTLAQWATVRLTWDGRAATGGTMPEDFVRIEIEARKKATGNPWVVIGSITEPNGFYIHANLTKGDMWEYRGRAIDRSENESDYSTITEAVVISIESDPQYIADKAAALAASTVAVDLAKAAQAAAVAVGEIDGKRFTMAAVAPSATAGYPEGATWTQRDATGAQIAFWQLTGGAWVSRPLARVAIPAIDIGSGTFGNFDGGRLTAWSVTSDKVLIGAGRNLIPNASFEIGTTGHTAANGALSLSQGVYLHGTQSLVLTTAAGSTQPSVILGGGSKEFKARLGNKFRFKASFAMPQSATIFTSARLQIYMYSAAGAYLGPIVGASRNPSTQWTSIDEVFTITAATCDYIVPRFVAVAPAGNPGGAVYLDAVELCQMETGELIVDGAVKAVHVDADAIEARHIKLDVGLVNKLYADQAFIGAGRSQYWRTDMLDALLLNTVRAKTAQLDAAVINGADVFLTSETYASGKLQVRKAGSIEAIQLDAEGLHGLPDYRLGARAWTLNMDNQFVFNTPGGTVRLTGVTADLNLVGNFLSNSQNVPAVWWNTKHPAGTTRLRAPAITWHATPGEFRIDGLELQGSAAGGVGISLAYQGDQDAIALGNIYQTKGYMYRSSGGGAYIQPGNSTWPRLEMISNKLSLGVTGGQNVGLLELTTGGARLYASGEAKGLNGNISLSTNYVTIDAVVGTEIKKYLNVSGNMGVTGAFSAGSKNFVIPHPDPAKAAQGMILRYGVTESPHAGVENWSSTEPATIGADGTVQVPLGAEWTHLTRKFTAPIVSAYGGPAGDLWATIDGDTLVIHGAPGAQATWLVKAVRADLPLNVVEEIDLERALQINDSTPGSTAVQDALLEAIDAATAPTAPTTPPALATVAGAIA